MRKNLSFIKRSALFSALALFSSLKPALASNHNVWENLNFPSSDPHYYDDLDHYSYREEPKTTTTDDIPQRVPRDWHLYRDHSSTSDSEDTSESSSDIGVTVPSLADNHRESTQEEREVGQILADISTEKSSLLPSIAPSGFGVVHPCPAPTIPASAPAPQRIINFEGKIKDAKTFEEQLEIHLGAFSSVPDYVLALKRKYELFVGNLKESRYNKNLPFSARELIEEFEEVSYDSVRRFLNCIQVKTKNYLWIVDVDKALQLLLSSDEKVHLKETKDKIKKKYLKNRRNLKNSLDFARRNIMKGCLSTCLKHLQTKHASLSFFQDKKTLKLFEFARTARRDEQKFIKMLIDEPMVVDELVKKYWLLKHLPSLNKDVVGLISPTLANLPLSISYAPENPSKRRKLT